MMDTRLFWFRSGRFPVGIAFLTHIAYRFCSGGCCLSLPAKVRLDLLHACHHVLAPHTTTRKGLHADEQWHAWYST